jgi:hypothetical protein
LLYACEEHFGVPASPMRTSDLRLQKVCATLLLIAYFPAAMVNADNGIEVLPAHALPPSNHIYKGWSGVCKLHLAVTELNAC